MISRVDAQSVIAKGDDHPVEGHDEEVEDEPGLLRKRADALVFPFHHFLQNNIPWLW